MDFSALLPIMIKAIGLDPVKTRADINEALSNFNGLCETLQRIENKLDKVLGGDYDNNANINLLQQEKAHASDKNLECGTDGTVRNNPANAGGA